MKESHRDGPGGCFSIHRRIHLSIHNLNSGQAVFLHSLSQPLKVRCRTSRPPRLDALIPPAVTSPDRAVLPPGQTFPTFLDPTMTPSEFVTRWSPSGGGEIANSQSFLKELCDLIGVPHPEPSKADEDANTYTFEKAVKIGNGDGTASDGRIDLYRRGAFVLESKPGTEKREREAEAALATVTQTKKHRKGHAERGSSHWVLVMSAPESKPNATPQPSAASGPIWILHVFRLKIVICLPTDDV